MYTYIQTDMIFLSRRKQYDHIFKNIHTNRTEKDPDAPPKPLAMIASKKGKQRKRSRETSTS